MGDMVDMLLESWLGLVLVVIGIIFFGVYWPNRTEINALPIGYLAEIAGVTVVVLAIIIISIVKVHTQWKRRAQARTSYLALKKDIEQLATKECKNADEFKQMMDQLNAGMHSLQCWYGFFEKEAKTLLPHVKALSEQVEQRKERFLREEEAKKAAVSEKLIEKINIVFEAFRAQGHTRTIPVHCKDFPKEIIEHAKRWIRDEQDKRFKEERKRSNDEREWKDAAKFVWKHHALPVNFVSFREDEKARYEEAMALDAAGKLKDVIAEMRDQELQQHKKDYITDDDYEALAGSVEAGKKREKELMESSFFLKEELPQKEQKFLQQFLGFKEFKASDGDKFIPVLYRCDKKNEGPAHFCSKHLFARLHPGAQIEMFDSWRNEVDVVFKKGNQKLAVEIERGTNKPDYVRNKVNSLQRARYAQIILVVPRDMLPKYRVHHEGKRTFVLTPETAKKHILDWLK